MNKQLFNRVADIAKEQPRVELGLMQDLIFSAKTANATIEEAVKFLKEADPLIQAASNRINEYNIWIEGTLNEFKKINKDAQDLGVKPNTLDGYTEAEKFLANAKKTKSTYDGLLKIIKGNR